MTNNLTDMLRRQQGEVFIPVTSLHVYNTYTFRSSAKHSMVILYKYIAYSLQYHRFRPVSHCKEFMHSSHTLQRSLYSSQMIYILPIQIVHMHFTSRGRLMLKLLCRHFDSITQAGVQWCCQNKW